MSDFQHLAELLLRSIARRSHPGHRGLLPSKGFEVFPWQSERSLGEPVRPPPTATVPGESSAVCSICKGAGRVRRAVPFGHPDFGKDFVCVCKERESRQRRTQQMIELCEAFGLQRHQRIATFQGQIKGAQEAFEQTRAMIERLQAWAGQREDGTQRKDFSPMPSEWLVLLGQGKHTWRWPWPMPALMPGS